MHSHERFNQQQSFQQPFHPEIASDEAYPFTTMDSYNNYNTTAWNNQIPFSFCEAPTNYAEAPFDYKFDMTRTASTGSMHRPSNDMPPALLPSGSIGSAPSSTVGSPHPGYANMVSLLDNYSVTSQSCPTIIYDNEMYQDIAPGHFNADPSFTDSDNKLTGQVTSVDPNLLSGAQEAYFTPYLYGGSTLHQHPPSLSGHSGSAAPSPAPSHNSYHAFIPPTTASDYTYQTRPQRRMSVSSQRSGASPRASGSVGEDGADKYRCPYPECGREFRDLKAHILTHQASRPEKCPIPTCEYFDKGFARKYDKNRHTLTHYKGTMVCGFCPGSGSPAEKSFNRADVFKRHLTSVHNVEQNPPNSRKRSPGTSTKKLSSYCSDATGKCSTCSYTFNNAQVFYEHLDDCVLRVVQREEPSEAINAQRLAEVAADPAVQETFERHMIKQEDVSPSIELDDRDEEDEDEDEYEDDDEDEEAIEQVSSDKHRATQKVVKTATGRAVIGGNISKNKSSRKNGMTWSALGVSLTGKGRRRRGHYPPSWGMTAEKMKMKKRVVCVYNGDDRLLKDDMMLYNEYEVRVPVGNTYVTDLDVETLKRAEAYHNASPEERGYEQPASEEESNAWIQEQDFSDFL